MINNPQALQQFLAEITERMEFYHYEASRQRISQRLSPSEIAKQLNISTELYNDIESGKKHPSFELAIRIADTLNVLPEELVWLGPNFGKC